MKALAIDLGGSHAMCAVVNEHSVLAAERVPLEGGSGLAPHLPNLAAALRGTMQSAVVEPSECVGLAFGFCGIVDGSQGRVLSTNAKYDDAPGLDLQTWASDELGVSLRLENDARLALLGEHQAGAAQGCNDVVMMTLGTGVGGAAMMHGRLLRGRHNQAAALGGHQPAVLGGRRCTCGGVGCVEAEAGGWSLPDICWSWPGFGSSALAQAERIDFRTLFEAADRGDAVATAVRERCLQLWSIAALGMVHAFDPELVVVGGGVMSRSDVVLPYVERHLRRHAWTPWGQVGVRAAALGEHAALLGALPLLFEQRS